MQVPITEVIKGLQKTVVKNSPAILTAVAVTGTVSTAVLAGKAAFIASEELARRDQETRDAALTRREQLIDDFKETWTLYIPAAAVGTATVVCIIGAHTLSSKRQAALISAYSLTEKAFSEYKDKVVEQVGINKEQKIRDSIAQDRVEKDPASTKEVIITGNGDVLCYETMSGRYFYSSVETIRRAQNDINSQILNEMYASQNDFNRRIGLAPTGYGEEVGWNTDKMLDVQFSTVMSEDQKPCISIGYKNLPFPNYHYMH